MLACGFDRHRVLLIVWEVIVSKKFSKEEVELLLSKYKFDNSEKNLSRLPMEREAALLNLVRQGKYHEIQISGFEELAQNLGTTAKNKKKHYEYYTVAGITLLCRAAIDGGMKPDDAYDLSDVLLQELERAKNIEEIYEIFQLSGVAFAKAVFYSKRQSSSYVIEQCKLYISNKIFTKIKIEDIAEYVGLNPKYVSRLFAKRERMTIHDYIQKEKIDIACNLLKHSDRSVSEIALYMGFQSQSNFGAVFRKWKYMTPTEYRNRNYQETYYDK